VDISANWDTLRFEAKRVHNDWVWKVRGWESAADGDYEGDSDDGDDGEDTQPDADLIENQQGVEKNSKQGCIPLLISHEEWDAYAKKAAKKKAAKKKAAKEEAAKENAKGKAAKKKAAKVEVAKENAVKGKADKETAAKEEAAKENAAKGKAGKETTAKEKTAKGNAATRADEKLKPPPSDSESLEDGEESETESTKEGKQKAIAEEHDDRSTGKSKLLAKDEKHDDKSAEKGTSHGTQGTAVKKVSSRFTSRIWEHGTPFPVGKPLFWKCNHCEYPFRNCTITETVA